MKQFTCRIPRKNRLRHSILKAFPISDMIKWIRLFFWSWLTGLSGSWGFSFAGLRGVELRKCPQSQYRKSKVLFYSGCFLILFLSYLWLKIQNPFIFYQDSTLALHIISLLSFSKVSSLNLNAKIISFAIINEDNLVFLLEDGEFVHLNKTSVSTWLGTNCEKSQEYKAGGREVSQK